MPSGPAPRAGVTDLTGLVHHTDAGSQYTSFAFTSGSSRPAWTPRSGSVGDAYDNALAESQIGLYKTELIRPEGPWRDVDHVELETLNWVDWFNHERPHESIDDLTPIEAEDASLRCTKPSPPGRVETPNEASGNPGAVHTVVAAMRSQLVGRRSRESGCSVSLNFLGRRLGVAGGACVLVAAHLAVASPAVADSADGNDSAFAGAGTQHAEWHASARSVAMWVSPYSGMDTDRCMDAMLDWRHTAGAHYDARVVRSCKPGVL